MGKQIRSGFWPRKTGKRAPYKKVLVVCEGEKTEPNYFTGLKDQLRLNTANVEIVGEGATPTKIVQRARGLDKAEQDMGDPFDKVYCVFDKEHEDYDRAVNTLSALSKNSGGKWEAIVSVPAFEYWLLLHYEYTTRPYQKTGKKSAGEMVISDLKKHCGTYTKNDKNIFRQFQDKLDAAKKNAERSLIAAQREDTDNPSTTVHKLVDFLQKIKNS